MTLYWKSCPRCHLPARWDTHFCARCGYAYSATAVTPPTSLPDQATVTLGKGFVGCLTAVGLLVAAALILALLGSFIPRQSRDLALEAACIAAAMQVRHPSDASWPHMGEAVVTPIGQDRWEVRSSVAGPNAFGMTVENDFVALVSVPHGARSSDQCQVESLQFSP